MDKRDEQMRGVKRWPLLAMAAVVFFAALPAAKVRVIRSGQVVAQSVGETPFRFDWTDTTAPMNEGWLIEWRSPAAAIF